MTAIDRLAEFAIKTRLDDCPREGLEQVRRAALDSLGVMLAGASEPVARIVREVARVEGGAPLCTVAGTSLRTSPTWASLANGAAGHAHDFDDTSFALLGHPSVPLFSALLAAGEAETAHGALIALGYVIGFEVDAALGTALNPAHYERGWHATSTLGTMGCAAAACRVLGLDLGPTREALGIAASLASGVKENFGSMTKPYHAGHAARNGVLAAMLAREGMTASAAALDGPQGWFGAAGERPAAVALDAALDGLGHRWHLVETGVAVKPYPSCALTHSAIDAILDLRREHGLRADTIEAIEVGVNHVTPTVLIHPEPTTALQRKFSMQYCAAAAAVEGRVDLTSFADGEVASQDVRDLMGRVRMVVDRGLPDRFEQHAWSAVTVRLRTGRVLASPARGARGHHDQPLPMDALRDKFLGCATTAIARDDAEGLAEQLAHLEDVPDIRAVTARLAGDIE
jgi:2-methylcitrate dehydratase PrpD